MHVIAGGPPALAGSELHVIAGRPHGISVSDAEEFTRVVLGFSAG